MKKGYTIQLYQHSGRIRIQKISSTIISDFIVDSSVLPNILTKPNYDANWKFYVKAITSSVFKRNVIRFSKKYAQTGTFELKAKTNGIDLSLKQTVEIKNCEFFVVVVGGE